MLYRYDPAHPTPSSVGWRVPRGRYQAFEIETFHFTKKLLTWRKKRMGALLVAPPTHTQLRLHRHTPYIHYTHTCPKGRFSSVQSLSHVRLFATPWITACQASLSITNSGVHWDSLTSWTWVWTSSRSWWWTGKPGVLQSMGSQRVGHDWVTKLNWINHCISIRQTVWWIDMCIYCEMITTTRLVNTSITSHSYCFHAVCVENIWDWLC